MYAKPRVTLNNYISSMVSPYHAWFRDLGYPQLDITRYDDGEWAIIQYLRSPVIPALTPWNHVLTKMRHVEISPWIVKKYVENLDVERRYVWDELERKEKALDAEQQAIDRHAQDSASRKLEVIKGNPALMERIARHGLKEIGLRQLARHIPNHHYRKDTPKHAVLHRS